MPENTRLSTILKHFNLTQPALALQINCNQSQISKMLRGLQKITPEVFEGIIEKYNINPMWLLGKIGYDDKVLFNDDVVLKEELEKEKAERYKVMEELLKYKTQHVEELQKVNS